MTLLFGSEKGIIFSDVIDSMILIISFSGGYMEEWEIEVKEHWNKISDSEWYQSLRTDDRLSELICNDLLSSVFSGNHHKLIFSCF